MREDPPWKVTDHVCKLCLGRVLEGQRKDGTWATRCADCEARAEGRYDEVCCCGAALPNGRHAGLACVRNEAITRENPSEVAVIYVGEDVRCRG